MFEDLLGPRPENVNEVKEKECSEKIEYAEKLGSNCNDPNCNDPWGSVDTSNNAEPDCDGCGVCEDDGSGC